VAAAGRADERMKKGGGRRLDWRKDDVREVALQLLLVPELPQSRQAGVVARGRGHGHGGGRPGAAAAAVGRGPVPRHGAARGSR
jgi:hypothetical protein